MRALIKDISAAQKHIRDILLEMQLTGEEIDIHVSVLCKKEDLGTDYLSKLRDRYGSKINGIIALMQLNMLRSSLPSALSTYSTQEITDLLVQVFRCGMNYGASSAARINFDEILKKCKHSNSLRRGNRFLKTDPLKEALNEIVEEHYQQHVSMPDIEYVWLTLKKMAGIGDIQCVYIRHVEWWSSKGVVEKTSKHSVEARLSRIRKKYVI